MLMILNCKDQGLSQSDTVKVLGYGLSTVIAVYIGRYRTIPFIDDPKKRAPVEKKVWITGLWAGKRWTSLGWAILIRKQGLNLGADPEYKIPNYVGSVDSENTCVNREEAMFLYSVLDTLTERDRGIIQAKADERSDRAVKVEFKTSVEHIRAIRTALIKKLGERGRSMLIKTYTGKDILPGQEAWFEYIPNRPQRNKPRSEKWWKKGPWWKGVAFYSNRKVTQINASGRS